MKRRWLVNLLLLLVAATLLALMQRDLRSARSVPRLTDLLAERLLQVEIVRAGEPNIRIGHSAVGWRMERPLEVDADERRIARLLELLSAPVYRSIPAQAAALEELGLAPPRLKVRLDTLELAFGGIDPITHHRYVDVNGLIHLIDDRFYPLLIAPSIDFVSRAPLPRGFRARYGMFANTPLAADSLQMLSGLVAERIDPLSAELPDIPLVIHGEDGQQVRFLVSDDHRRWARLDRRLLYVFADVPRLELDPEARPPADLPLSGPSASGDKRDTAPAAAFFVPSTDPNVLVPGDLPLGPPPEVSLTPDEEEARAIDPDGYLHGEPDKPVPEGFGVDPFAPDTDTDSSSEPGAASGAER